MLGSIQRVPNFLHLVTFCDESTFVLPGRSKHSVSVYCSRENVLPSDVCYILDLDQDPVKVHFFLAVTANPPFQPSGVVLYDVCTGTTDINRLENKHWDGSSRVGNWEYTVKNKSTAASSTTEEEMQDLLYLTTKKFHAKTGHYPYLNYDNNKIQTKIGEDTADPTLYRLRSQHGPGIVMPKDHKLPQPTHSPDCNRPVEHAFGGGKARVRNNLYLDRQRVTSGRQLQQVVHVEFTTHMPPMAVQRDILQPPLL